MARQLEIGQNHLYSLYFTPPHYTIFSLKMRIFPLFLIVKERNSLFVENPSLFFIIFQKCPDKASLFVSFLHLHLVFQLSNKKKLKLLQDHD